jgi:hypothetical protein
MGLRLLALAKKELSEHWLATTLLGVLVWLGFGVQLLVASKNALSVSLLDAVARLMVAYVPVAVLVLGRYVVVREYHRRTQLFVEALPIRRTEMLLTKYVFGWVVLGVLLVPVLAAGNALAANGSWRLFGFSMIRALGFAGAFWSFAFAMGLLGRLRLVCYLLVAIGLYLLHALGDVNLWRVGPFALVDPVTFAYERERLPAAAILHSGFVSAAALSLGLGLGLIREGSLAETLSRRASTREKSALTVLVVVALLVSAAVDPEREPEPHAFQSVAVVQGARRDVAVMYGWPDLEPHGTRLVAWIEAVLDDLDRLEPGHLPAIRVAHDSASRPGEVRPRMVPGAGGLLLEANLSGSEVAASDVLYEVAHEVLVRRTKGRAAFEPQHWVLDGYAAFLAAERVPAYRERQWRRAQAASVRFSVAPGSLESWDLTMERLGESTASAVALAAFDWLAESRGRARALALARDVARSPAPGLRAWLSARKEPERARFERIAGESWPAFCASVRAELDRLRRTRAAPDDSLLRAEARVGVERSTLGGDLVVSLTGPAPATERVCTLLHQSIFPFDQALSSRALQSERFLWPADQPRVMERLRGRYGRGQRLFAAVECELPELESRVRLAAARVSIP